MVFINTIERFLYYLFTITTLTDEEDQKPPLLHVAPHVRCSFSFGGKMVMTSVGDASNVVTLSEIQVIIVYTLFYIN